MKFHSSIFNSELGRVGIRILALGALAYLGQAAVYTGTNGANGELIDAEFRAGPMAFEDLTYLSFAQMDRIVRTKPDVIFLCDSTAMANIEDIDQRNMPEILRELLPEMKVGYLYHPGWTFDIYERLLSYLMARGASPKIVVAPVNIRSFGVPWYQFPALQFPRLKFSLKCGHPLARPLIRPLCVLKATDLQPISNADYGMRLVTQYHKSVRQFGKPTHPALGRGAYSLMSSYCSYVFMVEEDHPLLNSMILFSDRAKASGAELLIYTTPTDLVHLERTLGSVAVEAVRENFSRIHQMANQSDITIVEFAYALEERDFFPVGTTASHLRDTGRQHLAKLLSREILVRLNVNKPIESVPNAR